MWYWGVRPARVTLRWASTMPGCIRRNALRFVFVLFFFLGHLGTIGNCWLDRLVTLVRSALVLLQLFRQQHKLCRNTRSCVMLQCTTWVTLQHLWRSLSCFSARTLSTLPPKTAPVRSTIALQTLFAASLFLKEISLTVVRIHSEIRANFF